MNNSKKAFARNKKKCFSSFFGVFTDNANGNRSGVCGH